MVEKHNLQISPETHAMALYLLYLTEANVLQALGVAIVPDLNCLLAQTHEEQVTIEDRLTDAGLIIVDV